MTAQTWRDLSRIPLGMSDFGRWFRPEGIPRMVGMSDLDGILHTRNGNRFLMFEFKPEGAELTRGQEITLHGFSLLPGCTSLVVFDPYWDDDSREPYPDDLLVHAWVWREGVRADHHITIGRLNKTIATWFNSVVS